MGSVRVPLEIGDLRGERWERLEAEVDTGSTYVQVPRSTLERLGVTPIERRSVRLATGERVERDVADARVRLDGQAGYTRVIFGEEDAAPLVGVLALETFDLAVDPVGRRLVPANKLRL